MRVIIAGSRDITDYELVKQAVRDSGWTPTEVVSGGARGVDRLGERWAHDNNTPCQKFPAKWRTHGRAAGHIRNREMAEYADALIALWDNKSKGTRGMIDIANARGLKVYVLRVT